MRHFRTLSALALVALLAPSMTAARPAAQGTTIDATIASIKSTHEMVKGYVTKAAAQVPEAMYTYQPTKEVRTMGQLFGHIANASLMICGTASGMKSAATGDAEKLATKAEIEKALAAAFSECDQAFKTITAANANEGVTLFGKLPHTRVGVMAFNNAHNFEHYGNIVTYMRMNKLVPPSSGGK
jgi:uncharacterized damage-inducible protein DinB